MNPHAIEVFGFVGSAVINASAIPQIFKSYRTKSAKDFSWLFFASLFSGMILNLTYGVLIHHPAIYIGSSASLILYGSIAGLKYYYEVYVPFLKDDENLPLPVSQLATVNP